MEKLSYQAIARSVDLGEFSLGLHAAAYLQTSLHQFKGDAAYVDADTREDSCLSLGGMDGKSDCSVLRLRSFAPPNVSRGDSLELAKLISGASLNTCRCALEVGSMEALGLIVGSLGHSAGKWINRVSHHGEVAKAGEHDSSGSHYAWINAATVYKLQFNTLELQVNMRNFVRNKTIR